MHKLTGKSNSLLNLKLFLTLLVIFHHAGQAHMAGAFWPYSFSDEAMNMPWIWHFFSTNASFFMGLFFLIAGYFVPGSFNKHGAGAFVKKKLLRLGVPCVLMTCILSAMVGHLEIGHMWFVENLLLFCLLYALYKTVFKTRFKSGNNEFSIPLLLAIAIIMGIAVQTVRQFSPQDRWINVCGILYFEPARYPQYIIMFIAGLLASHRSALENISDKSGITCLAAGLLLAAGNYLRAGGAWDGFVTKWFGFYESLMCVSISFGLVWLFRRCFNGSNSFTRWCCARAYTVYIIHLPLMVALQFATDGMISRPIPEFFFIAVCTTVLSFGLAYLIDIFRTFISKASVSR